MSGEASGARIRHLAGRSEYEAAVALQERIWGENFGERVAPAILQVAQKVGGVTAGAFAPDGTLVGFVFGITGIQDGRPVHWSDMLAVLPEWRGRGLSVELKAFQRADLLDRNIPIMRWTFDPLEARNAYLNLSRLGAVSREYVPDMYGAPTSPLHQGLGTDRLVILWELDTPRTEARLAQGPPPPGDEEAPPALVAEKADGIAPVPREPDPTLVDAAAVTVAVPPDIQGLKAQDPKLALRWREAVRSALRRYLDLGFEARELLRSDEPGILPRYLLVNPSREEGSP